MLVRGNNTSNNRVRDAMIEEIQKLHMTAWRQAPWAVPRAKYDLDLAGFRLLRIFYEKAECANRSVMLRWSRDSAELP